MLNANKENDKNTSGNFVTKITDKYFILIDRIRKKLIDSWDDFLTIFVIVFGSTSSVVIRAVSKLLAWSVTQKSGFFSWPLNIFKLLVGSVLATTIFLLNICGSLIFGAFASALGMRNLGSYSKKEQFAAWFIFFILLIGAPVMLSNYTLFKVTLILVFTIGVLGLDFLYGQCGIVSLGYCGFLVLGGYVTTWLSNGALGLQLPMLLSVLIAGFIMAILGIVIGAPSLRVKDYYLVIMSMTFALAIPGVLKAPWLIKFTGAREGGLVLRDMQIPEIFSKFSNTSLTYFFVAIPAAFLFFAAYNVIHRSQFGRALKTIKCDSEVSMIMGIPVVRYKILAFVLSAFYGGICGGFLTILTKRIHPDAYNLTTSINFLVANIIGGPSGLLGSFFGGVFLSYETDITLMVSKWIPRGNDLARGIYGLLLILTILFMPRGIAGQLAMWVKGKFQNQNRRGVYHFNPPPDYDFLPDEKDKNV